jgi:muramoyltetrapeptide carboxypeptidase
VIVPPALRPGDRVHVVAPSSPFDRESVERGIEWLESRYHVVHNPGLFSREGLFAGSDARRLAELDAALRDPEARAVLVARGGHGLLRIVRHADVAALARHPKWVAGFSDVTALHQEIARAGVASIHGPNLSGLGRDDPVARDRVVEMLEAPAERRRVEGLLGWRPGRASGVLTGGNLTLLFCCAASGRLHLPDGAVLLIEDVTEQSYRVDRMLTVLIDSGALDRVAAVVVGDFVDCPPGPWNVAVEAVLGERLAGLGVPVVAGIAVGHGARNDPLPLGLPATVDGDAGTLEVGA